MDALTLFSGILVSVATSVLTTIGTTRIQQYMNKQASLPKFLVTSTEVGFPPSEEIDNSMPHVFKGYFKKHRELDEAMELFLENNGINTEELCQFIMRDISNSLEAIKNGTECSCSPDIKKIVTLMQDNPRFNEMVKVYNMYRQSSQWVVTIKNTGGMDAHDFKICTFPESEGQSSTAYGTLGVGESWHIVLHYFDSAVSISSDGKVFRRPYGNDVRTRFKLCNEQSYRGEDERLLKITYRDDEGKNYCMHLCAYIGV